MLRHSLVLLHHVANQRPRQTTRPYTRAQQREDFFWLEMKLHEENKTTRHVREGKHPMTDHELAFEANAHRECKLPTNPSIQSPHRLYI